MSDSSAIQVGMPEINLLLTGRAPLQIRIHYFERRPRGITLTRVIIKSAAADGLLL